MPRACCIIQRSFLHAAPIVFTTFFYSFSLQVFHSFFCFSKFKFQLIFIISSQFQEVFFLLFIPSLGEYKIKVWTVIQELTLLSKNACCFKKSIQQFAKLAKWKESIHGIIQATFLLHERSLANQLLLVNIDRVHNAIFRWNFSS